MELMYAFAYSIVENVTVYFERFDGVARRHMHTVKQQKRMDASRSMRKHLCGVCMHLAVFAFARWRSLAAV